MKEICTLLVICYISFASECKELSASRPSIIQVGCPACCYQVCALNHAKVGDADLDYPSEPCHRNVHTKLKMCTVCGVQFSSVCLSQVNAFPCVVLSSGVCVCISHCICLSGSMWVECWMEVCLSGGVWVPCWMADSHTSAWVWNPLMTIKQMNKTEISVNDMVIIP